jgi:hypothetical protein
MPRRSPALVRALTLLLLAVVAFSGCVYLRLLALKNQLNAFEKNFAIEAGDGLKLVCKNPILLSDDLRWLGIEPKSVEKKGPDSELWHVRWVKEPPAGLHEPLEYDVRLDAGLVDRRVTTVQIPERYFEYFPKSLFLDLLRSTGTAKINKEARRAEAATTATSPKGQPVLPRVDSISKMLGAPTEQTTESGAIRYMYRYRPQSQNGKGRPIEVTFFFEAKTGTLHRLMGKLPRGTVNFEFSEPSPAP